MTAVEFRRDLWRQKTRVPRLSCGVVCVILRFAVLVELRLMTDRRTDRQTDTGLWLVPRCVASRGKNLKNIHMNKRIGVLLYCGDYGVSVDTVALQSVGRSSDDQASAEGDGERARFKKVAVVEDFFDIIYNVHVEMDGRGGKHAGQKRTYRAVSIISSRVWPACAACIDNYYV